jgi:peptide chain release factor 2
VLSSQPSELRIIVHDEKLSELVSEKKDIAWGSQMRSYVFQTYQPVRDHRTRVISGNVNAVMDGSSNSSLMPIW